MFRYVMNSVLIPVNILRAILGILRTVIFQKKEDVVVNGLFDFVLYT